MKKLATWVLAFVFVLSFALPHGTTFAKSDAVTLYVDGVEVEGYEQAFISNGQALLPVEKLTGYGRIPYKNLFSSTTAEDEQAVEWALECTNLTDKRKVPIDELSGGQMQRVWIAMALAQKTPFLFLDEPTTYLDIYYQYELLELIKSLNRTHGMSIVMVLHDINQAIRYSDTIIAMKNGEIVVKGAPSEVITAQTVKEIYGVDVVVKTDEQAGMYIVPVGI